MKLRDTGSEAQGYWAVKLRDTGGGSEAQGYWWWQ